MSRFAALGKTKSTAEDFPMIIKEIDVDVISKSFPKKKVPQDLLCSPTVPVNISESLLMLGQITSPSGFSAASPARYWAWLRYFSAVHASDDLRITAPFMDLDPHQKTILSDDLGVAITVKWLHEQLGGFAEIVDGRRFALHYASLMNVSKKKRNAPKVGYGKCPDFVVRDHAGKWHVVECKGTQTSASFRDDQLKSALEQKKVIDVQKGIRGHRLALGLFLGNERAKARSHLKVLDPKVEPYVRIGAGGVPKAETAIFRLAASRALAMSGFDEIAEELSLPTETASFHQEEVQGFFTIGERRRLARPASERIEAAMRALRTASERTSFEYEGSDYLGQEAVIPISSESLRQATACSRIRVNQGANAQFISQLRDIPGNDLDRIDEISASFLVDSGIKLRTQGTVTTLVDGEMFAAQLSFLP